MTIPRDTYEPRRKERPQMRPEIAIRSEAPDDHSGVEAVIMATMRAEEARLVELIRASPRYLPELTLVAVDASGLVVGHVMVSDVDLVGESTTTSVLCLAPLAVTPAVQRTGVGSALVGEVLDIAQTRGDPLMMVLGDAGYYQRFGFERARPLGIVPAWSEIPDEAWMVRRLQCYSPALVGTLVYPPAFDDTRNV